MVIGKSVYRKRARMIANFMKSLYFRITLKGKISMIYIYIYIYIFEIILRNNFSHQDLKDEKFSLLSSIKGKENRGSLLSDNLKERKYYSERVIETVTPPWKRGPKGPFNSILNF